MATDAILWIPFFLMKGKAMSYLQTIRAEEDTKDIDGSALYYDDNPIYNFDQSAFNFW